MRFLPQKNAKMTVFCTLNTKKHTVWPQKHIKKCRKLRKFPVFVPLMVSKNLSQIWFKC
jgi:hypothetical protein